jgi:hypothetical protein
MPRAGLEPGTSRIQARSFTIWATFLTDIMDIMHKIVYTAAINVKDKDKVVPALN